MSTISASTTSTTAYKVTADTTGTLVLQTGSTPTTAMTIDGSQNVTLAGNITLNNGAADGSQLSLASSGFSNWNIDNYSGNFRWYYNATEYMRLDASGNLGVGTTSPTRRLHIVDNQNAVTGSLFSNTSSGGTAQAISQYTNGTVTHNFGTLGTGYTTYGALTAGNAFIYSGGNQDICLAADGSGVIKFGSGTGVPERARIDSSGNLLVGTTGLDGRFRVEAASGASWARTTNHTNNGTQYFDSFRYNGTEIGKITGNNSNVSYVTSSDYRLKDNIQPLTDALATVALLKPCTYTWKIDGALGQGFIAHELQAVVPDAVVGEKDAVNEDGSIKAQGIDTSFLVATLTAAIQEQQAIIETLTNRITALEAK